jgi:predicted ATPase/DNA-binding CsgD family transcriptional regulator
MAAPSDTFVGRLRELATLHDSFDHAVAGRGRMVMLAGEPGIGKTRTARELALHAEQHGATVLWGYCHEEAGAPPYWPWVQIFRGALRTIDPGALLKDVGAGASDIADIVPEIRNLVPDLEPSIRLEDAAQARFRMFESIRQFFFSLCRRQTALLVLDDLHWADAPSLRLLEFLAPELGESRLMLVGTYRPTELSRQHPLSDTLGGLARTPHMARVSLGGLSAEEVHDFVAAATGTRPPAWLATSLYAQTEGNPLFLREIVRFLEHQGLFRGDRTSHMAALPAAIRIPEGVREVIGRRLNLLSVSCNEVLGLAAVVGREFSHDLLLRAARRDDQGLIDALDEALVAHIIEESSDRHYQFAHNLIRLTLYDELRPARRRQLHGSVGAALEVSRRADIDALLPELARHFLAAGDIDRAIDYATRAGQRAEALLAFEDAVDFFQTALDAMEQRAEPDDAARCRLLFLLGEALRKANAFPRALTTLRDAAALATELGNSELSARAALAYEQVAWRSAMPAAPKPRHLLERALQQLSEAQSAIRTQVMGALARALLHDGASAEAKSQGEQAIAMARQLGDPGVLATCLYCLLDVVGGQETDDSLRYAADALAAARQVGNLEMVHIAHAWRFLSFMERGDIGLAEAELESTARLDARLRQRTYSLAVLLYRIMLALMRGELPAAERLIVQSMALLRSRDLAAHEDHLSLLIFTLRREQGRLAELRPVMSAFLHQSAAGSVWRPGLALLYLEVDQRDAARIEFEQMAAGDFATIQRDGRWLLCMVYLSEVCAALGDAVRAVQLYGLLLPYAGRNIVGGRLICFGSADRYLGLLCTAMSDWTEAEHHFEAALTMNSRIGAHAQLAHMKHDYAAMLLARDAAGDRQRAAGLLQESLDSASQLGMRGLQERAAARLAQSCRAPAVPDTNDDLTSREIEVLRLLAIGRSNADIGLVLAISLNTVATHVRNILAKTGCANRTEAAGYAMRHGLAGAIHQA